MLTTFHTAEPFEGDIGVIQPLVDEPAFRTLKRATGISSSESSD